MLCGECVSHPPNITVEATGYYLKEITPNPRHFEYQAFQIWEAHQASSNRLSTNRTIALPCELKKASPCILLNSHS